VAKKRVLAVISQDPILTEAAERLRFSRKTFEASMDQLVKQIKETKDAFIQAQQPDMMLIEKQLLERGILKDPINQETHSMCVNHGTDAIELHEQDAEGEIGEMLKSMGLGFLVRVPRDPGPPK